MRLSKLQTLLFIAVCLLAARPALACPDIDGLADLNCDRVLTIAAFGDSITDGELDRSVGGYPGRLRNSYFPHANILNYGKGGETTSRGRSRAASIFNSNPNDSDSHADYAILLEGVNDYFNDHRSSSDTRNNLLSIKRSIENAGATTSLATLTDIKRSNQRPWVISVNSAIRSYTSIDFFSLGTGIISSDKLHPNSNGYQAMAGVAAVRLQQVSASNRPADNDHDGVYDFAEARFGTNPALTDTDGDGISDGNELFVYGSNPLSLDSDGDGVSDQVEVFTRHTNPASPLPTAPTINTLTAVAN